jgi:hypothetical protein
LDAYLRALEESVLQAHLAERGALVIMALVHPSRACWRAPALRGGENIWVLPFDPSQTRTQLRGLERAGLARSRLAVSYVQDYSGGLALLNYLLARCEQRHAFELLLDYCFSRIPAHECNRVKSYLEALCVLEVLEHAAIQRVLAVYHRRRPGARLSPTQAGEARNVLRKYWLARSTPDTPGRVVLVESVRRAAREVLKERDAELYAALNEAAHATPGGRR